MDANEADVAFFDHLTASPVPEVHSDGLALSTTPSPPPTVLGKRPRNRPYTCCDVCKTRKVKCDGGSPCTFCAERDFTCVYSQRVAPKRQKTAAGTLVIRARPQVEAALLTSNARQYYLDLFLRKINPMFRVFDANMFSAHRTALDQPRPRSHSFEEGMALAHTARALGHLEVANQLYQQARMYAGDLIDDFSSATAVGYALMVMYTIGQNNNKATHYANIADSITKMSEKDMRTLQVIALIKSSHILEGPNRPCYFDRQAKPFVPMNPISGNLSLADVWGSQHSENLLDLVRTFPVNSELLDIYCNHKLVARYPVEQRTNKFLDMERVELALKLLQEHAALLCTMALAGQVNTTTPWMTRQHLMRNGCVVFLCAATGLVEAARFYCRLILSGLQEIPSTQASFGYVQVFVPAVHAANFVHMYKVHPFDTSLDYRSYLREICDIVRPLAPMYDTCAAIVDCLTRMADEPLSPPQFTANPNQAEIFARWARIEKEYLGSHYESRTYNFADAHEFLHASGGIHHMEGMASTSTVPTRASPALATHDVVPMVDISLDQLLAEATCSNGNTPRAGLSAAAAGNHDPFADLFAAAVASPPRAVPLTPPPYASLSRTDSGNMKFGINGMAGTATAPGTPGLGAILELNLTTGGYDNASNAPTLNWDAILAGIP